MKKIILWAIFLIIGLFIPDDSSILSASVRSKINKANKLYDKEKYKEALNQYRDAQIDEPESPELHFNLGNVLYKKENYEEAKKEFEKATYSKDIKLQSKAYYNIGNSMYRSGKLPESILFYKKCLELQSDDEDAKYNIEFVQKKLKDMLDKSKKQKKEQKQKQQKIKKKKMSKEDVERLMEALKTDEEKAQKRKKVTLPEYGQEVHEDW